ARAGRAGDSRLPRARLPRLRAGRFQVRRRRRAALPRDQPAAHLRARGQLRHPRRAARPTARGAARRGARRRPAPAGARVMGAPAWPCAPRPAAIARDDWRDWAWQMRHRIRSADELAAWVHPSDDERRAIDALAERFRFVITPYYASLMDAEDPACPVRRQVVPRLAELDDPAGLADPLDE